MHPRPSTPRARLLVVAAAYVVVALWFVWPLPLHGTTHVSYPAGGMAEIGADLRLITWALAWDTHALLTDPAHLFDANIFHPAPSALAFSEHFLGYVPLFAPTYLATGNPILASNVLLFLTYPLCALAAYALARRFVSAPAAFVAGAAYAFCGLRYDTLYHLHQLGTFWLPLAILLTERWLDEARARDALLLAATLALQLLSSFYLAYALLVLYGAYLALAGWWRRGTIDRRRIVGLVAAVTVAALPFVLASLPYLRLQQLGVIPSGDDAASGIRFTLDPRVTRLQIDRYLTGGSVGLLGWMLVVIALLPAWRARSTGPGSAAPAPTEAALPSWRTPAYPTLLGVVLVVTGILFAAGPRLAVAGLELPSPYAVLQRTVPGFSTVRLPARFLVVTQLGLALLTGLGIDRLLRRVPGGRAWPAGVLAAAALLLVAGPWGPHPQQQEWPPATHAELLRELRDRGDGGPVVELPIGDVATSSRRMIASTVHWLPSIDGYSAYPPPTRNLLRRIAAALPDPTALQQLVDLAGVRWVVLHLADLSADERRAWQSPPPGLEEVGTWGADRLYRVTLTPQGDLRTRIRSERETLGGARLAPLGEACPGRLGAVVITADKTLRPGTRYDVATLVENLGSDVWPGFSMFPRHVVTMRLTVRAEGDDRPALSAATFPLWHDVAPGPGLHLGVDVTTPKTQGDYVLEVSLVQEGETLDRCGTPSLRLPLRVRASR
jgi:hypothetical protein